MFYLRERCSECPENFESSQSEYLEFKCDESSGDRYSILRFDEADSPPPFSHLVLRQSTSPSGREKINHSHVSHYHWPCERSASDIEKAWDSADRGTGFMGGMFDSQGKPSVYYPRHLGFVDDRKAVSHRHRGGFMSSSGVIVVNHNKCRQYLLASAHKSVDAIRAVVKRFGLIKDFRTSFTPMMGRNIPTAFSGSTATSGFAASR